MIHSHAPQYDDSTESIVVVVVWNTVLHHCDEIGTFVLLENNFTFAFLNANKKKPNSLKLQFEQRA